MDTHRNAPSAPRQFNAIEMEVFSNRLLSITEEMGNTLIRSSFSSNIKERKDCSVALFDARGRLVVQAAHIPVHLGSLSGAVEAVRERFGESGIQPDDSFISNDAYLAGGSHAPDITLVTPIFWQGQLRFFAANVGHHTDVGGGVPGSTSHLFQTVWEEGLRIPAIKIARGGEIDRDLLDMIAHNTREPEYRVHDIRAQIATNFKGVHLVHALLERSGVDSVLASTEDLLAYTERRLSARIAKLPAHAASFTEYLDDDGLGGEPVAVQATVQARDGQLHVDFAGSGPQARGSYNMPRSALQASVYFAVKTLLDPYLMPNNGMAVPIVVTAPEGSIVNPRFPAAVGARATTAQRVAGAVIGALGQLLPESAAMASCNDVMPAMVFSGPRKDGSGTFVYLETIGGGAGGRAQGDGMDGVQVHITNTSNLPAEALEIEYPLLVEDYSLVQDSGGAGTHRGGMGIARQIRSLSDTVVCSARCDGGRFGAAGLSEGGEGGRSRIFRNFGQAGQAQLPNKVSGQPLRAGDSVRLETPGGGGYGNPSGRAAQALARDLRGGKASRAAAEQAYGRDLVAQATQLPAAEA